MLAALGVGSNFGKDTSPSYEYGSSRPVPRNPWEEVADIFSQKSRSRPGIIARAIDSLVSAGARLKARLTSCLWIHPPTVAVPMPRGRACTYICVYRLLGQTYGRTGESINGPSVAHQRSSHHRRAATTPRQVAAFSLTLSQQQPGYPAGSHGNTWVGAAPGRQSELAARMRETSGDPSSRGSLLAPSDNEPLQRRT